MKTPKAERSEGDRKKKRGGKTETPGGVAQLGEHLPCKQGVRGSIPLISTRQGCGEERTERDDNRTLNYGL